MPRASSRRASGGPNAHRRWSPLLRLALLALCPAAAWGFDALVVEVREAVEAPPIAVVAEASASEDAEAQGSDTPGNRVLGLVRNDRARRMFEPAPRLPSKERPPSVARSRAPDPEP